MAISFKPSEAIKGGLFQDVDVRVDRCRAAIYDYNGKSTNGPVLAVHMTVTTLGGDPQTEEVYYSVGSLERFAPGETEDGAALTNIGDEGRYIVQSAGSTATGLSDSCNFMFFVDELKKHGYPEDRLTFDLSGFEGMEFHAIRKPQPKRAGIAQSDNASKRENTTLVAEKILKYPWDAKGTKANAAAASAGSSSTTDLNAVAVTSLQTILSDPKNGGSISPAVASKAVFAALLQDKKFPANKRKDVMTLVADTNWLESNQGPEAGFMFDGTSISSL